MRIDMAIDIYMSMYIIMNMNIYIEPSMSGLINSLLRKHYGMGGAVRAGQSRPQVVETPDDRPVVVNLGTGKPVDFTEADDEEEEEFWKSEWVIDRITGNVVDLNTGELQGDFDRDVYKWLQDNGKYV